LIDGIEVAVRGRSNEGLVLEPFCLLFENEFADEEADATFAGEDGGTNEEFTGAELLE
jgi:hypothetical protein